MSDLFIALTLALLSPHVTSPRAVLWVIGILAAAYFIAPMYRIEIRREHV